MYKKSYKLAYILGVYLGDGSTTIKIDKKGGNKYRFQLGSIDKEFVDKVNLYLASLKLHSTRHIHQTSKRNPNWKDMYFLTVSNKEFVFYCRNETGNKQSIPAWVHEKRSWEIAFINGILDSEGYVAKCKVNYGSGHRYMVGIAMTSLWLRDIVVIMKKYGVIVGKEGIVNKKSNQKVAYRFQFNLSSFIRSPFKFSIIRKQKRLLEYKNTVVKRTKKYYSAIGLMGAEARWS